MTLTVVVLVAAVLLIAAVVLLRTGEPAGVTPTIGGRGARVARGPQNAHVQQLRQSLMTKAMGDASKVDAWLDYERRKSPSLSEEECYVRANERWERDNR
jgi:hypothetical protein